MRLVRLLVASLAAATVGAADLPAAPPVAKADAPASEARAETKRDLDARRAGDAAHAALIDQLIDKKLAADGAKPPPPATDAAFARRAYLAIIGRDPTRAEAEGFLADHAPDKRARLVDKLLDDPARVHHEFTWMADLLRVETSLTNRFPGQSWIDWVKNAIRTDEPWDRMVREMVEADGLALERGNGATGFYLRDNGMPLDHAAMTVQEFLGTRMGCAQCHDHPFDVWKRYDFYQMAAYTSSVDSKRELDPKTRKQLQSELQKEAPEVRKAVQNLEQVVGLQVRDAAKKPLTLPADYQYPDHKSGEKVAAKAPFGPAPTAKPDEPPRHAYASWLTAPDNPRFALAIANRMFKRAFGRGLIEPVDDIKDDTVAADPELMAALTTLMVDVGFDLKRFEAALYHTKAWQRAATPEPAPGERWSGGAPMTLRLSAEQLWDSLLTLRQGENVDDRDGPTAEALYRFFDEHRADSPEQIVSLAREAAAAREQGQALAERAKELKQQIQDATPGEAPKLREQMKELAKERDELMAKSEIARLKQNYRKGAGANEPQRADDLPQPAPPNHLLRTFGQSDRQVIDNGSRDGALPQALTLMNGVVDQELLNGRSRLRHDLDKAGAPGAQIEVAYLSILGREPSAKEREVLRRQLGAAPKPEAIADVVWALVNSREFLFTP